MPTDLETEKACESLTAAISAFAADTPSDRIPDGAFDAGKRLILDTLGCALAASNRRIGRTMIGYVTEENSGPAMASVIGSKIKVSPSLAALANGTMAHALALEGGNHLPTHIVPAVLALAEQFHFSGRDVLAAVVVGYEVGLKLTHALGRGPTERGWWHPKLVGPIAAAVAAARLIGLDRRRMAMAIGIAATGSGGFRRNMGTMSQAFHSGLAARDGIQAAELARRGFTADPAIVESPLGFARALCGEAGEGFASIGAILGKPYALEKPYAIKPFPVCGPAQPLIEAVLSLRRQGPIPIEAIESIDADLHYFSLLRPEAPDEDAAGYSGAYVVAAALVRGDVWIDEIAAPTLDDPAVRGLMERVRHVASATKGEDTVTIRLSDGRVLTATVSSSGRRESSIEVGERKFRRCAERILTPAETEELKARILDLDRQPSVGPTMDLMAGRVSGR